MNDLHEIEYAFENRKNVRTQGRINDFHGWFGLASDLEPSEYQLKAEWRAKWRKKS